MKKLLQGIADFHHRVRPGVREAFARLALGQAPDCLFVACSDSRVVPNLFASTDPGDLFVVRNVGNLVPPCGDGGLSVGDRSEGAAIEFAVLNLGVRDVVVCGHSECGAMRAMLATRPLPGAPNLHDWLHHGEASMRRLEGDPGFGLGLPEHDRLGQANVLQQLEHLRGYPAVREAMHQGRLRLHGWWFDIAGAEVHAYDADLHRFVPLVDRMGPDGALR